ncbi:MAG: GLPGLI family protein [Bacteroidetes bacterium]|nr:MAG: GLPGLI family protein [Bacteroidota bacterium]
MANPMATSSANTTKFLFGLCLLVIGFTSNAQAIFLHTGRITYEKRTNQHARFLDENDTNIWAEEQRKATSKILIENPVLTFNETYGLYTIGAENANNKYLWNSKTPETDNTIINWQNKTISKQKEVFEKTYLIQDSIHNMQWRITGETRTIAGFNCRKAVGKIMDSVYVVAFYTDDITAQVGPESFSGLPGAILGLAIPRLHTTWFATKVEAINPPETTFSAKQKGIKCTRKTCLTELQKSIKDWGKFGIQTIWNSQL